MLAAVAEEAQGLAAAIAACATAAEAWPLLGQLHGVLFPTDGGDSGGLRARVRGLTEAVGVTSAPSRRKGAGRRGQTAEQQTTARGLALLEAALRLADIFLTAAAGEAASVTAGQLRRLDAAVPAALALGAVTPAGLRDGLLQRPWDAFAEWAAGAGPGCLGAGLTDCLEYIKTNQHCDFIPRLRAPPADVPPGIAAAAAAGCLSWAEGAQRAGPRQQQARVPRSRAGLTTPSATGASGSHGIPAYLLSRRAPAAAPPHPASTVPPWEALQQGGGGRPHPVAYTLMSDSEDSNSLLATETPIKRRRVDPSLYVPPSPVPPCIDIKRGT